MTTANPPAAAPKLESSSHPSPAAPYPPLPRRVPARGGGGGGGGGIKRPLFGGALHVRLPPSYRDVSAVREVPDHQEVWQDFLSSPSPSPSVVGANGASTGAGEGRREDGGGGGGSSSDGGGRGRVLVVEILTYQDGVEDDDAGRFFFDDLADANGAAASPLGRKISASGTATVGSGEEEEEEAASEGEVGGGKGGGGKHDDDGDGVADGEGAAEKRAAGERNLMPNLGTRTVASLFSGYQLVAEGRDYDISGDDDRGEVDQEAEWVHVELCAVRLRRIMTDLLITLSTPVGKALTPEGAKGKAEGGSLKFSEEFQSILGSLAVDDWTLFA